MLNFIALVAIALGAFIAYENNATGLSPMQLIQTVAGVGGGILFLIMNNFKYAVSALSNFKMPSINLPTVKPVDPVQHAVVLPDKLANGMYPPNDYELYDQVSLIHIRNRLVAAENDEGVKLCTKLAEIMFTLDVKKDVPDATKPQNL